jgi:hypothetical protein
MRRFTGSVPAVYYLQCRFSVHSSRLGFAAGFVTLACNKPGGGAGLRTAGCQTLSRPHDMARRAAERQRDGLAVGYLFTTSQTAPFIAATTVWQKPVPRCLNGFVTPYRS